MILLIPILLPLLGGLLALCLSEKYEGAKEFLALAATLISVIIAALLFKSEIMLTTPWLGFGIDFSLRLYHFSAFILLAINSLAFLILLYSTVFMAGRRALNQFYSYFLLTIALASGAVLANNLILFLFFWEGLLLTLFGLIYIGGSASYKTAIKAFIIIGITDLCLMLGIALTGKLAGTFTLSNISLPLTGLAPVAFILLMIGALAKAGAMPFHSWIPDAATDAPLPFMALLPGALEKLIGIYFLTRISLDLFKLTPASWLSPLLMVIGALTIVLAVLMALIQKDYKRLLSYHAISQVGYMILGIGTALPVGIIGGLFHMINNALYKSCLFLTGGAVEKQTGTTELSKLGGLAKQMPITFACFLVAAVSISGVPPFNGFFSKELVYAGALSRGWIFYLAAVVGSFFTAASFLKLGHAAYFDKAADEHREVKEAAWPMLLPMIVITLTCIVFGVFNSLPLTHLIDPIVGGQHAFKPNIMLILATVLVLTLAILNHIFGVKRTGQGLGAVDHIHYAPGFHQAFAAAEKRYFDPYEIGLKIAGWFAQLLWALDRLVDWLYEGLTVRLTQFGTWSVRAAQTGNVSTYVLWALTGTAVIAAALLR